MDRCRWDGFIREEIKEALADGYGESVRYSNTLSDKQLYSAIRLSDGSVLRLSIVQMAVWTLLLGFAQPICFVILIAFVLSFVLASSITKWILKPINSIDPDDPLKHINEEEYKEITETRSEGDREGCIDQTGIYG